MTAFTFGIITDTHIRVPGGDMSSPFPVNEKANGRARYAVSLMKEQQVDFTVHLGDVVHPLPHMASYVEAAEEAHEILGPLKPHLHFVPGNHDIGDKPSPGMPAKASNSSSIAVYESAFGESWSAFTHRNVLFVTMNSSLVNSGLPQEAVQKEWLEKTLRDAAATRTFLFSHYPPFIAAHDEQDHYDNYAEPGRSWLLELAAETGVEAIFSGHVHHFFYNSYKGVKLYCLLPTSFTRQDYAELFPVEPTPEFGRDDVGKFAVATVTVDTRGHEIEIGGTYGHEMKPGASHVVTQPVRQFPSLIPHLRHAWFEQRSLPYNGPMEEFSRKQVRNDYPLLRLLQLGIKTCRIPFSDLLDPVGRARIDDWNRLGFRFVFFKVGLPTADDLSALNDTASAAAFEVLTTTHTTDRVPVQLSGLTSSLGCPIWISKVTTFDDRKDTSGPFAHTVSSGFLPHELEATCESLSNEPNGNRLGVVFQIPWGDEPEAAIHTAASTIRKAGLRPVANLRIAHSDPAVANFDPAAIVRVLELVTDAAKAADVPLQCDTFEDVDRGYHPRFGLIDRHCNIRSF